MARVGASRPASVARTSRVSGEQTPSSSPARSGVAGPRALRDVATIAGLSAAEMTPNVRAAILRLLQEVDALQQQLAQARRQVQELETLADQDPLLPVLNRRAFVRELSRTVSLTRRYGVPSSIVYLDVNGMKQVNDTYGHAAGDAVLAHVCRCLLDNVREGDVVGRMGGDEFGVILMHADATAAERKASRLAEAVRSCPIRWQDADLSVGVAYGYSVLSGSEDAKDALAAADRSMYRVKGAAGR